MSKNIEININSGNNTYETLFPVTDYNILQNKPPIPTVPSLPLSVSNGGTGQNSVVKAIGNLIYNASNLSSSNINSNTRIGASVSSTDGRYINMSDLLNYIKNNLNISSGSTILTKTIKYTGNGSDSLIVNIGLNSNYILFYSIDWNTDNALSNKGNPHTFGFPCINENFNKTTSIAPVSNTNDLFLYAYERDPGYGSVDFWSTNNTMEIVNYLGTPYYLNTSGKTYTANFVYYNP